MCGWQRRGTEEAVIAEVQGHGVEVHGVAASREESWRSRSTCRRDPTAMSDEPVVAGKRHLVSQAKGALRVCLEQQAVDSQPALGSSGDQGDAHAEEPDRPRDVKDRYCGSNETPSALFVRSEELRRADG